MFLSYFKITVSAENHSGSNVNAITPVSKAMKKLLESNTITITCGNLTIEVIVNPKRDVYVKKYFLTEIYFNLHSEFNHH